MQNQRNTTLIALQAGMSMAEMDRLGLISRELAYFEALSRHIGPVAFITYGTDRKQEEQIASRYFPGSTIAWTLPARFGRIRYGLFFGSWLPPLSRRAFKGCAAVRSEQLSGAWAGVLVARRMGIPFILRCGYLFSPEFAREHTSKMLIRTFTFLERVIAKAADAVIVTYPGARDFFMESHGIPGDRIHVLGNPVDTDLFRPLDTAPERDGIIVARFTEQKNLFSLIEAAAMTGMSLTLVGRGHLEARLKDHARKLGVDAVFVPPVLNSTIPELIARHRMFIFPSNWEGNPKALIEAMACARPCIASDIPENTHLIDDGVHGLICNTSPASIAACMKRMAEDPSRAEAMGRNARDRIVNDYSMESIARREGGIHRDLLRRGRKG
ncbi:MAG TPA: glycosyltransferase [Deltaproteobacteria bacterium]|nr:glycosyltransferase [Deltaproteobacteria bacterium]HPR53757.1 glycosyltransferase [Deltaproteobacteria bacterium]HXK46774.1 glycosyltransferase [Deltaproteobacteria bacterium]